MIRLGFLGTGWIGLNRMEAILATGKAQAVALHDPNLDMAQEALKRAPGTKLCVSLADMLREDLDGVVIATPSALQGDSSSENQAASCAHLPYISGTLDGIIEAGNDVCQRLSWFNSSVYLPIIHQNPVKSANLT